MDIVKEPSCSFYLFVNMNPINLGGVNVNKTLKVFSTVALAAMIATACSNIPNKEISNESTDSTKQEITYENFPSWGYDVQATRHVPFTQITKENINDLGVIWQADFKTLDPDIPNGNQSFSPVVDGVLYVSTGKNHVFAFDAVTGKELWHWKPDADFLERTKSIFIVANRGVAVAEGKVFMLTLDNRLVSIDAKTGETVKIVNISDAVEGVTVENGYYEATAPIYYNGNLYIGSSGGDNGVRGFVMAYKASDLSPAWDQPFWTVPPKGQDWLANSKYNGGGAVWCPISIDPETDIMYFGTGNPAPDFYGVDRPGANPYTDSVIALDSKTGKLIWVQQEVSHDLWDYDAAATPMVIKAKVNGEDRKLVVQGGKSGEWWAFDAATGEIVHKGIPFAKIDHPEPTPEGVLVYPGIYGGQNYAPETYDPETNYVLIPGIEAPSIIKSAKDQADVEANSKYALMGTTIAEVPADIKPYGTVTAMDVNTGKIAYQYNTDDQMRGGFTSTATGIAFYGELSGKFKALDIKSGEIIWDFQTSGNSIGSAPSIFTQDGKEYIALTTGGNKPKVMVFGLGGDKTQGETQAGSSDNVHGGK